MSRLSKMDAARGRDRTRVWRAVVGWAIAILTVLPVLAIVVASLKPEGETFSVSLWPLTLENFAEVLTVIPMPLYLWNTALVATVVTVISLVTHAMAAYALARLRFRGSAIVFNIVVATLMVSMPVILLPLFLIVREFGMIDTPWAVIVPMIFNAFGIFLLRQTFVSIPDELEQAAELDGCGYWGRFIHVVLPLARPTLVSLGILFFLANWNSFMWPKTVLATQELWMVQQGLAAMQGQYGAEWHLMTAAAVLIAIPTTLLFFVGQRHIVASMRNAGLK